MRREQLSPDLPDGEKAFVDLQLPVRVAVADLRRLVCEASGDALSRTGAGERPAMEQSAIEEARRQLQLLQRRSETEHGDLFADPAWQLLLDLLLREEAGLNTSVSSACLGSGAPSTTGLRYLLLLTERGLVDRNPSPVDQRVQLVHLTKTGRAYLIRLLAAQAGTPSESAGSPAPHLLEAAR